MKTIDDHFLLFLSWKFIFSSSINSKNIIQKMFGQGKRKYLILIFSKLTDNLRDPSTLSRSLTFEHYHSVLVWHSAYNLLLYNIPVWKKTLITELCPYWSDQVSSEKKGNNLHMIRFCNLLCCDGLSVKYWIVIGYYESLKHLFQRCSSEYILTNARNHLCTLCSPYLLP